jgi:hypothetical protein
MFGDMRNRNQWIGLMPIETFIDKFIPRPNNCPDIPDIPREALLWMEGAEDATQSYSFGVRGSLLSVEKTQIYELICSAL